MGNVEESHVHKYDDVLIKIC